MGIKAKSRINLVNVNVDVSCIRVVRCSRNKIDKNRLLDQLCVLIDRSCLHPLMSVSNLAC